MILFNADHIGQQIAAARRRKNMTQSALADELGVSYQAVSNWERRQSLPDIDKYAQLSETLNIPLEDLIGSREGAKTITTITDTDTQANIDAETLTQGAIIMSPDDVEAKVTSVSPKIKNLIKLAPFISQATLFEKVSAQATSPDFPTYLHKLAPFLTNDDLERLIATVSPDNPDRIRMLGKLAPFRAKTLNDQLVDDLVDADADTGAIRQFFPFISAEKADTLFANDENRFLTSLAPFVSDTALIEKVKELQRVEDSKPIRKLMPFLSEETLLNLFDI